MDDIRKEGPKFDHFYVTSECLNLCQSCLKVAPENLEEIGDTIHIKKQPEEQQEVDDLREAARICPADAIRSKKSVPPKKSGEHHSCL